MNYTHYPLLTNSTNNLSKILGLSPNELLLIAGPCAIEDAESLLQLALELKKLGVKYLRAGAFKPRTSPYDFQGLGLEGLTILKKIKAATGLKIVTEIPDASYLPYFEDVDIIQIGARNMQNFTLLQALGKTNKPLILKRGFGNTIDEWYGACEYILKAGNPNVILCERGIKTFENSTRNTLDISSIALTKLSTSLPIIFDPSHASGRSDIVEALSLGGLATGADGIIIEVHQNPHASISDANQALSLETFKELVNKLNHLRNNLL